MNSIKFRSIFGSNLSHRRRGDQARARAEWAEAALAYREHLVMSPRDNAIWVQLGHALKEIDQLGEAEEAYRSALKLHPSDKEVQNHLAHLLKRVGAKTAAADLFACLFQTTGAREPHVQMLELGRSQLTGAGDLTLSGNVVFLEIDDLLMYLEIHDTVSGIQRVQLGVIQHVLSLQTQDTQYEFVVNDPEDEYLWRLARSDLEAIVDCMASIQIDHSVLKMLVIAARQGAKATIAQQGQAYVALGAFWHWRAVAPRFAAMKRAGVTVGVYVYDLIPITHSEFCVEELSHEFKLSFGDGLGMFDFVLTISEFTASEVRRYIERAGLPTRPVVAVPLAHANEAAKTKLKERVAVELAGVRRTSPLAALEGRPYALMVSTIEARKNHAYLITAWRQFIEEGLDPPDLVFVGRTGWRVLDLMEMLNSSRFLDGRVHVLHGLSDTDLTEVYDKCLFTLFPSFVEGWGLPVGESLARGKPCVASATSSIPEVGGDFVDYLNPMNLQEGIGVIRRMAFDEEYREQRTVEIRRGFIAREWAEVSGDLLGQVATLRQSVIVNKHPEPRFALGEVFRPGSLVLGRKLPNDYAERPLRSMLTRGWHAIEQRGCWMQRRGTLAFRSDLEEGTLILVYIQLYSPPFSRPRARLLIDAGGEQVQDKPDDAVGERMMPDTPFTRIVAGKVGAGGTVCIELRVTGPVVREGDSTKGRQIALGFAAISYALDGDDASCRQVAERMLTTALEPFGGLARQHGADDGVDWDEY